MDKIIKKIERFNIFTPFFEIITQFKPFFKRAFKA